MTEGENMTSITVHQSIHIHFLKVENISNSSILQIGSTGNFTALSEQYNSGQFKEPALEAAASSGPPLVPLSSFA